MHLRAEKISIGKSLKANRSFLSPKEQSKSLFFQPKLTIGPTDDVYEREADAVADKVMRMEDSEQIQPKISPMNIQRMCPTCEEEEKAQRKEQERSNASAEAPSIVSDAVQSGGKSLEKNTRSFMESRMSYDFSNVKIHTGSIAAKSAQSINALAYTSGNNIVFNEGQYTPNREQGKKLLAHELVHIIQQANGASQSVQRMLACPGHLDADDSVPSGWKPYHGNPCVFHCCYRGILEDRTPTQTDPMNECFYDNSGTLVDQNHQDAGCRGTPDYYDSATDPWDHTFNDPGGIWEAGWEAFWASRAHAARTRPTWGRQGNPFPDGTWYDEDGRMHMGPGPKW